MINAMNEIIENMNSKGFNFASYFIVLYIGL